MLIRLLGYQTIIHIMNMTDYSAVRTLGFAKLLLSLL